MRVVFCRINGGKSLGCCEVWNNRIKIDLDLIKVMYPKTWRRFAASTFLHELAHYFSYRLGFADWGNPEKLYKEEILCYWVNRTSYFLLTGQKVFRDLHFAATSSVRALHPNWNPQ